MKPAIRIGISASLKSLVFFFFTYSTPCSLLSCEKEKEKKKKRRVLGRLVLLVEHLFSSFHLGWFLRFFFFELRLRIRVLRCTELFPLTTPTSPFQI